LTQSPDHRFEIVVSIINFRTAELTLQCLHSVLDDLAGIDGHVVIVDNRSDDGSAEIIGDAIAALPAPAPVTLVRSATNSGFSGGHNQGMAVRPAEFYLILNSDALLRPGFLRAILDGARAEPGAGLFAPRIDYDDGSQQISCFRFPGPASELMRGAQTGGVTRLLGRREIPLKMPPAPDQIEWASFACILLRGEMVAALGPMDEGYFLYFEDIEYCLRARRAGWRVVYLPQARAVHFRGGSGPVKSLSKERKRLPAYYYASRTRFLYQAHGWVGLMAANLAWFLGRGIAQVRRLAGKPVPASNRAEARDIWTNALTPLGDRRAVGG
jgi:N-acetylglucosaminyl-diphospho-decaprenol L-rhamnosyltransferase